MNGLTKSVTKQEQIMACLPFNIKTKHDDRSQLVPNRNRQDFLKNSENISKRNISLLVDLKA